MLSYTNAYRCYLDAEDNNPLALYKMGLLFYLGNDYKKDFKKAKSFFERAKQKGYASGAFRLGEMYHHGFGVVKDFDKALSEYQCALQGNILPVFENLSEFFKNAIPQPQERRKYLEQGTAAGSLNSMSLLAVELSKNSAIRSKAYLEYLSDKGVWRAKILLFDKSKPSLSAELLRRAMESKKKEAEHRYVLKMGWLHLSLLTLTIKTQRNIEAAMLYHLCATHDIEDPAHTPVLLARPNPFQLVSPRIALSSSIMFMLNKYLKNDIKRQLEFALETNTAQIVELLCYEKDPFEVINILSQWGVGDKIKPLLDNDKIREAIYKSERGVKEQAERISYLQNSIFRGATGLARIVEEYYRHSPAP